MKRAISLLALLVPAFASAQTLTGTVSATATTVHTSYCISGMAANQSCTVTLTESDGTPVDDDVSAGGGSCRQVVFSSLTPGSSYLLSIDCGTPRQVVIDQSVTTQQGVGNVTSRYQIPAAPHIPGFARATVAFGPTTSFGSSTQNTSCSSGCVVEPSMPRAHTYVEIQYQDSSNNVLKRTRPMFVAVGNVSAPQALVGSEHSSEPAIPELADWEDRMVSYGESWCASMDDWTDSTIYDGCGTYGEILEYTHDPATWDPCWEEACNLSADFILPSDGNCVIHTCHNTGFRQFYQRKGVLKFEQITRRMGVNMPYSRTFDFYNCISNDCHREMAYTLEAKIDAYITGVRTAEQVGQIEERVDHIVDAITDLIDPATSWRSAQVNYPDWTGDFFFQPFMGALIMNALIRYYHDINPDATVRQLILDLLDWMWDYAGWLPSFGSSSQTWWLACGTDGPPPPPGVGVWTGPGPNGACTPAADIAMLIAGAYAWGYTQTCDNQYRAAADATFAGAIPDAAIYWSPKQFRESYQVSIPLYYQLRRPKEGRREDDSMELREDGGFELMEVACP